MNNLIKLSFFLILIITGCKDSTIKKKEITEKLHGFNAQNEKSRIDTLINNEKLAYYHYLKPSGEDRLIEYTGDDNIFDQFEINHEYLIYYNNSQVIAVKVFEQWGEEGHSSITYYYNANGKLFCYDYFSISASEGNIEQKATIYMDENVNIINESYQRKNNAGITNNKMDFEENPMFYKTVNEIMNAFGLEDCKRKIYNSNSSNNNHELSIFQVSGENLMTLREIKLALLDASLKKCKVLLGEPDKLGLLYMGGSEKNVAIYLNKVNDNGILKHLVLFLRYKTVEEVFAIKDNEKAYFGIHYVVVRNSNFYSNSTDFDEY